MSLPKVEFKCNCNTLRNLSDLYCCTQCSKLSCNYCCETKIDSYFCPVSLTGLSSDEVSSSLCKSNKHFQCPQCESQLVFQATTENSSQKLYLSCNYCRYRSDTAIGLTFKSMNEIHKEYLAKERISHTGKEMESLKEYYSKISKEMLKLREFNSGKFHRLLNVINSPYKSSPRLRKKFSTGRNFSPMRSIYSNRYSQNERTKLGGSTVGSNNKGGGGENKDDKFSSSLMSSKKTYGSVLPNSQKMKFNYTNLEEAIEKRKDKITNTIHKTEKIQWTDQIPKELKNKFNVTQITSLQQRFSQLTTQPRKLSELSPQRIRLMNKKSKQCPNCQHTLIKPEMNPNKSTFKIKKLALFVLPQIFISKITETFQVNKQSELVISFKNPTFNDMKISNLEINTFHLSYQDQDQDQNENKNKEQTTANIVVKGTEFSINGYDESAQFSDITLEEETTQKTNDDPEFVQQRKLNKVYIKMLITPTKAINLLQIELKFKVSCVLQSKFESEASAIISLGEVN
ncbi:dynactin p62 subunit [Anaeramoeba flamelloides]|uniref:Dynactin subunit 4 n=1 Tax=Anaeramoeba flamelloides TaxID=1746091 RepID=A0ABQ8YS21_9EUKA|nr:dynactin p62 subunit [Anaeramoeba flamelloides]